MTDPLRRPTTVQALVAAVKRESSDRLRLATLILFVVIIFALGLSVGYLIGVKDIGADDVEAAGTWFGALATVGTVIIAAVVFLSDRLFQDYQLESEREREREEWAEKDRYLLAQARLVDQKVAYQDHFDKDGKRHILKIVLWVENNSAHRITQVRTVHSQFASQAALVEYLDAGRRTDNHVIDCDITAEGDLEQFILDHVTLRFSQNDHKWRRHGKQEPERDEWQDIE